MPIGEKPGASTRRQAWCMLLLSCGVVCSIFFGAPAIKADTAKAAPAQTKDTNPADFVGAEVCATCHESESKGFASNPHSKLALEHGKSGATCESCHGAGKAHVEGGGDITKIFDPAKATATEVDTTCLGCHAGAHPNFERSPHAKAGVSCIELPQRSRAVRTRNNC